MPSECHAGFLDNSASECRKRLPGDTATSQVIFTEYRQEKLGDPMKMTTQGKEYATWVKVNGQWLYKTRLIASGSNPPEGWKD